MKYPIYLVSSFTKHATPKSYCHWTLSHSANNAITSKSQTCCRSSNGKSLEILRRQLKSPKIPKLVLIPQNCYRRIYSSMSYSTSRPTSRISHFSTSTTPTAATSSSDDETRIVVANENGNSVNHASCKVVTTDDDDELLLYERDVLHPDAMRTTTFMRSGFVFSSLHTLYWFWYTFDFIPHVNKASMEILHVDPMIGVAGIVFAMSLQSAFVIYPIRLISKLTYRLDEQRICIYTHRLPNMYPSLRRPYTSFPLGTPSTTHNTALMQKQQLLKPSSTEDIGSLKEKAKTNAEKSVNKNIKYFTLDATTPVALNLIQGECQGDISKYRGHLIVGPTWPKYILDIKGSHEVKESALLLQALIKPEHFYYKKGSRQKHSGENMSFIRKSMSPYQLRVKSRQRSTPAAMKQNAKKRRR
jgi:hypothetical protein